MTASLDPTAYQDCYDLFDRALVSDRGIRVKCKDYGWGFNFRLRMNRARQLDREVNKRIHHADPLHPEYGKSRYSAFTLRLRHDDRGWWWLTLERNTIDGMVIEDIPADDDFVNEIEAVTGLDLSEVEELNDEREGAS